MSDAGMAHTLGLLREKKQQSSVALELLKSYNDDVALELLKSYNDDVKDLAENAAEVLRGKKPKVNIPIKKALILFIICLVMVILVYPFLKGDTQQFANQALVNTCSLLEQPNPLADIRNKGLQAAFGEFNPLTLLLTHGPQSSAFKSVKKTQKKSRKVSQKKSKKSTKKSHKKH